MPAAPLPANEADRLAALAGLHIMDSEPDPRFDSFVKLAADMYGVQIALVTLVDHERQWFKAKTGLETRQTSRESAFCAHTILNPSEVMVVEDATRDPRFADNPLVLDEPNIRFYAGAVVRAPSGHPMGTLCLIDRSPRTLDEAGRARLRELAGGVSALLDLHRHAVNLQRVATHDALTGLANRALFDHRLDQAVAGARAGDPCALLLLDLDRFKAVNDTLGHAAGDSLLKEVATRLTGAVRATDVCARFGGDEFAVLMTDAADEAAAAAIAARIADSFNQPVLLEGVLTVPQASIGIALFPHDATTPGALFRAADQSLYQVKRARHAGRSLAAEAAEPEMVQAMDDDLRTAVETNALMLHWQPVFDTRTLQPYGFEALRRWNRPGHGPVAPGVFIAFAEANGLIAGMDRRTLHEACRQAAGWPADLCVAVNISSQCFGGPAMLDLVSDALAQSGLPPHRLSLEITERTVIANRDIAERQISALHRLGIRVALDDFGTGFSSLAYLRDMPFDIIKLDRAFVSGLCTSARSDAVACGIIDLGHRLGMRVCAEGVETRAQLDLLRREGCDLVQGYFLGRPRRAAIQEKEAVLF
jgi:diguanylate cyclase (GGDEF)-like protein